LSLRAPGRRDLLGGALLVGGALPVAWFLGWLQTFVLPIPWETLQGLEKLVTAETPARLGWLLLLLAVTPAVCEEFVFRGVLLGGTRELATWRIVLLNGLVFGAFHLSFETAIRFLPTAWLGIVIAWAVLRTGSIWTGSLMHLINNGTIVLLASVPTLREMFSDPKAPPPIWALPFGALSLWAGVRVLSGGQAPDAARASTESEEA
jgi:sodium transport system permease protein